MYLLNLLLLALIGWGAAVHFRRHRSRIQSSDKKRLWMPLDLGAAVVMIGFAITLLLYDGFAEPIVSRVFTAALLVIGALVIGWPRVGEETAAVRSWQVYGAATWLSAIVLLAILVLGA